MNRPAVHPAPRTNAAGSTRTILHGLFGNVALWQAIGFFMLVCVVWVNEVLDLPNLIYQQPTSSVDWFGAGIVSVGIALIGFITVAHTYVLQNRILEGIIIVCSYCNRVKIGETNWEQLERFLATKTLARFSHGICPECYAGAQDESAGEDAEPEAERVLQLEPAP